MFVIIKGSFQINYTAFKYFTPQILNYSIETSELYIGDVFLPFRDLFMSSSDVMKWLWLQSYKKYLKLNVLTFILIGLQKFMRCIDVHWILNHHSVYMIFEHKLP